MGIDFVRKAAPTFRKGLDKKRIELVTPTLFTQQPDCTPRSYAAEVHDGEKLQAGQELGVRLEGQKVVVLRGLDQVATFNSPPADLISALAASHGEACGTVSQVHELSQTAEITLC
ncbi:MAG TPA: hypothetical protein VIY49_26185 [Bryobacteraceae bacterium]